MRTRTFNIVGISEGYHDAACCVLADGALVAAAQEERFSRVKNDKSMPVRAFRYCLREAGLSIADVDAIAYYEDPVAKLGRQIWTGLFPGTPPDRKAAIFARTFGATAEQQLRRTLGYEGPIEIVDHHLSHAASAFFYSGYPEAAILTVDGVGEWCTTTYGRGSGAEISRFEAVTFPDSLGFFYSAITGYLGFEVNEGEYKVMGLAPYGEPVYAERLRRLVDELPGGQFRLNRAYFAFLAEECMYSEELCHLLGQPPRVPDSELTRFHMDVARSAQLVLEEILLAKARYLHGRVGSDSLCMAGGVALNVVANSRCLHEGPFRRLFVQPAAGDAGGCLGAAALAHTRLTGGAPGTGPLAHVYVGPSNAADEIGQVLSRSRAAYRDCRGDERALLRFTVDCLTEGKVVGWVQGRMEFGPRALGARSILADPRGPDMRDRINALVKMRESFRPFAPAVLDSRRSDHFELDHASPFMLETCRVRSPLSLPAITHVDGSARVQTVDAETHPRFAALLEEFERRTGCPILLNTSFNMRGEPIVCTAIDAILCFVRSQIDVLILEDFVVERAGIPPLWEVMANERFERVQNPAAQVGHLVYTMF